MVARRIMPEAGGSNPPYEAKMKSFHNGHEPSRRRARSGTVRCSNHTWDSITDKGNSNRIGRAIGWMRIDF